MTEAERTEQLRTLTLDIILANVGYMRRSMHPETGCHAWYDHFLCDSPGARSGGGYGGIALGLVLRVVRTASDCLCRVHVIMHDWCDR